MKGYSREYTDRQVDLECLQTVAYPAGVVELSTTATKGATRRITGMQKAIQRYVTLLLTPSASVPFAVEAGNILLSSLRAGTVSNKGTLQHLFNMANAATLDAIKEEDYNIERFGAQKDDERIDAVELSGMTIDYATSTISLSLIFRTVAGEDYTYILPVSTKQV